MVYDRFPGCVPNDENWCCCVHPGRPTVNRTIFRNYVIVLLTWMGHTRTRTRDVRAAHDKCQRKWHVRAFIISICACVLISSLNSILCSFAAEDLWEEDGNFCTKMVCLWRIRLLCWTDRQVVCVWRQRQHVLFTNTIYCVCVAHQSFARFLDFIIIFFRYFFPSLSHLPNSTTSMHCRKINAVHLLRNLTMVYICTNS